MQCLQLCALQDIANKMRGNEIWANASEKEFDNAVEAMEKQIMNNLYPLCVSPNLLDA